MTLTYSEDNQYLTRELAGIPLFLTFVKKKGPIYTPARSLISHLHALKRNEPARAAVIDKFNTFTLEQELNMDETLREFFNDVYEITRQIPRGKVLTYGRIAALAGRPQHARWVAGNGTIPGRQDTPLPPCREQCRTDRTGMDRTTDATRKRRGHLPSQRPRGYEKTFVGNPISR